MLTEFLRDPMTFRGILSKQVSRKIGIRNALDREFSNTDWAYLGFGNPTSRNRLPHSVRLVFAPSIQKPVNPDAVASDIQDLKPHHIAVSDPGRTYRIDLTAASNNAVNWLCRQIQKGSFNFSRLRGGAYAKKGDKRPSTLPLGKYHSLDPSEKTDYRTTLRASFPDNLLLHALAIKLREAFPTNAFLPGVCAYVAGKSGRDVVLQVTGLLNKGYRSVLRFDVSSFNETVCQEQLLELCLARVAQLPDWGAEDRVLLERFLRSYFQRVGEALKTPGVGIGMGSPLTPLFTNIYLDQLDRLLDENGIPFVRYGDDVIAFFMLESEAIEWKRRVIEYVETHLKQRIKEDKTVVVNLSPDSATEQPPGFDFCSFHYSIGQDGLGIRIKDATVEKIKRKIRFFTRCAASIDRLPQCLGGVCIDGNTWGRIQDISILLGFPHRSELRKTVIEVKFIRTGWPTSFLREAKTENIRAQFQELDRYIRYRLERVERKLGGATGAGSRFYTRARRFGLRSFIDAWNRLPEPQKPA
jgi:hypothetical protein